MWFLDFLTHKKEKIDQKQQCKNNKNKQRNYQSTKSCYIDSQQSSVCPNKQNNTIQIGEAHITQEIQGIVPTPMVLRRDSNRGPSRGLVKIFVF